MKLNRENMLWFKDKAIEVDDLRFVFSVEGPKVNGELLVTELTVDAFENGEWSHELSMTYYIGDVVSADYEPWVFPQ